jgi:hypothetical protein
MASDNFPMPGSGKGIDAYTGNHLPQGTKGEGQGRVNILGETWIWTRNHAVDYAHPAPDDPNAIIAESACQITP